jgi:hypothetical protein
MQSCPGRTSKTSSDLLSLNGIVWSFDKSRGLKRCEILNRRVAGTIRTSARNGMVTEYDYGKLGYQTEDVRKNRP